MPRFLPTFRRYIPDKSIKVDTAVVRPATIQSKMKKRKREHKLVRKSKMKKKRILLPFLFFFLKAEFDKLKRDRLKEQRKTASTFECSL